MANGSIDSEVLSKSYNKNRKVTIININNGQLNTIEKNIFNISIRILDRFCIVLLY